MAEGSIRLVPPTDDDRPLFDRLAQLYAYDFSVITGLDLNPDGRFNDHPCFAAMWGDPKRFPFVFWDGDVPVGFAIVLEVDPQDYDIEQFCVLRRYRRMGIGKDAAKQVFAQFKGKWMVEQVTANVVAQAFWRNVIAEFTDGDFEDTGGDDPAQTFRSE